MASDLELVFDVNAARAGWTVYHKGWPDRLVVDQNGQAFFVEVKGANEPLRPHQYRVMTLLESLGVKVFIAANGGDTLTPLDEWMVSPSQKGRPAQVGMISRTTARSYGYKARMLLNQADVAEQTPGFPKERILELRTRAQAMLAKASKHWDGADKEFMQDISIMERASGEALETMRKSMLMMNIQAQEEALDRDALIANAHERLHKKENKDGQQATGNVAGVEDVNGRVDEGSRDRRGTEGVPTLREDSSVVGVDARVSGGTQAVPQEATGQDRDTRKDGEDVAVKG